MNYTKEQQLSAHTAKRCPRKLEEKSDVKVAVGMNDRKAGMNGSCLNQDSQDFRIKRDNLSRRRVIGSRGVS